MSIRKYGIFYGIRKALCCPFVVAVLIRTCLAFSISVIDHSNNVMCDRAAAASAAHLILYFVFFSVFMYDIYINRFAVADFRETTWMQNNQIAHKQRDNVNAIRKVQ